jgi:hypothetical protein
MGLILILIGSLSACSGDQEIKVSETSKQAAESNVKKQCNNIDEEVQAKSIKQKRNVALKQKAILGSKAKPLALDFEIHTKRKNNYVVINKEKFKLLSATLVKGAKVFNLLMSQYGLVKGSFVVIINNSGSLSSFSHTKIVNKIADSTYRLTPESDVDLQEYYHSLLNSESFKRVEMEIDYSGVTRPLTINQ